jgi:hypothetical protein
MVPLQSQQLKTIIPQTSRTFNTIQQTTIRTLHLTNCTLRKIVAWSSRFGLHQQRTSTPRFCRKLFHKLTASVRNHAARDTNLVMQEIQTFMRIRLLLHWKHARPAKWSAHHQSIQVTAQGLHLHLRQVDIHIGSQMPKLQLFRQWTQLNARQVRPPFTHSQVRRRF